MSFTTSQGLEGVNPKKHGVVASISRAAQATGVDFTYLLKTAQRESALNPRAKAGTSSAAGLFQFIEQTWLATVKAHGDKHGYGAYAKEIVRGGNGQYYVPNAQSRQKVLGLRYDAEAASVMAGELTAGHAAYLRGRIGRTPTAGELYAAHFLGPAGAANMIKTAEARPNASAVALFPQAAGANRSIFYSNGRPVTVTQLAANLNRHAGGSGEVKSVPDFMPTPDIGIGNEMDRSMDGRMMARLDRIRSDAALLNLAFGNGAGDQSLLIATQMLAAFGPAEDTSPEAKASWFKA